MRPKINELYFCKKTLNTIINDYLEKGKYYKLSHIYDSIIVIILNNKIGEISFSLYDDEYCEYLYFYDYFYTKKEERKEKLNQLLYDNV